ncbi:MAG: DUF763 domain-containing protein [Candidatus Lokiarchaeota archaeon]|nr:DUF763 domain-containing protein [Candidatus Lokiarchaeota archaeon]
MKRSGLATLKLHPGSAPSWLLKRMKKLANEIFLVLYDEFGADVILKRLSNPIWFQCLSNILGFDWNSSGTTTVLTAVLKNILNENHGVLVAGGKGKTALKTPHDLDSIGRKFDFSEDMVDKLKYSSRIIAKIDNAVIQDSYNLYHHAMFISMDGKYTIVQQGLNSKSKSSRRYHWHSKGIKNFIDDSSDEIISEIKHKNVLNMASKKGEESRKISLDLSKEKSKKLKKIFNSITPYSKNTLLYYFETPNKQKVPLLHYKLLPTRMNWKALDRVYEFQPSDYEELIKIRGIGPATIRGLALISELIYGNQNDWKDPVKYSYCLGGKDGVPYPVPTKRYDKTIRILKYAVNEAKIKDNDKLKAIMRLKKYSKNMNIEI